MVPKLRFKEFCGEWEEKRLGDVFKFMPTNSFSRNDLNYIEGDIYNIHYGDIHMIYPTITDAQKETFPYINREKKLDVCSELLCEDGDVLLADASEDYDDIGKAIEIINVGDKKIVSGLHTIFMKDYKKIYANKFRGFMMNSNSVRKQIKVLAAGAKVLGISKSNISKVKMPLPSLPEQTKIADFLSTVDEKIQNQKDKITHLENIKKGFMQKIFSRKIRFKDDGGEEFPEWEEKKLGEFIVGFNEKSIIENQYPILTSSSKGL
ncbi:MAG: restriction endonuclease subunit S, partial [Clostridiales bacterium]|nr:restriction endonuclease subunit S [Clostridiales bacterium]